MTRQLALPGLEPATQTRPDDELPAWVREQLAIAAWPISRKAHFERCPNCNALILRGLDHDVCAINVTVDPTPITRHLEVACIIAGRPTYTPWKVPGGYELTRRDPFFDTDTPRPILPAHQCGARFPGFLTPRRERTTHGWPDTPTF